MTKAQLTQIGLITLGIATAFLVSCSVNRSLDVVPEEPQIRPDFSAFTDVKEKKQAFFDYVLPNVRHANDQVLEERQQVLEWNSELQNGKLSSRDRKRLEDMAIHYEIDPDLSIEEKIQLLLLRVDMVPASLALAQAAKESGWGTSRFSVDGNNYFGQWCFSHGCGLVPIRRTAGATHEVRTFDSVEDSVAAYIHNLNTHPPYRSLREMRAEMRDEGAVTGIALADGLGQYSERGRIYVDEIRGIIRVNELAPLDRPIENTE